jgi:hypothetical protein
MNLPTASDFPKLAPYLYYRLAYREADTVNLTWRFDLEVIHRASKAVVASDDYVATEDILTVAARLAKEAHLAVDADRAKAAAKELSRQLKAAGQ